MTQKKRVVALISGRGSNLESLLIAQTDPASAYEVAYVLSDCDAPGLEHARSRGIASASFMLANYPSRKAQRDAIFTSVRQHSPDLIVLAGFMMIVPEQYTSEFLGKLINIHPALLPEFPGLDTHARAIAAGVSRHGCSIHFVDNGIDTGPLIVQASCAVSPDDTAKSLAAHVLKLEHRLLPWTVNHFALGNIKLENGSVFMADSAREEALSFEFTLP